MKYEKTVKLQCSNYSGNSILVFKTHAQMNRYMNGNNYCSRLKNARDSQPVYKMTRNNLSITNCEQTSFKIKLFQAFSI